MTETPLPYGTSPQSDFESQYSRILEAAGCRTQVELAAVLDVRQSSIPDAKRRQSVPSDWLMKLFEKKRINPEWIRTGLGGRVVQTTDEAGRELPAFTVTERRPAEDCTTDELLAEIMRRALKCIG